MKAYLLSLATVLMVFSCSPGETSEHHSATENAHGQHQQTEELTGLTLNRTERWQADEATNENMRQLQEIMKRHETLAEPNSVEALQELGQSLQAGFKQLFTDCRMKGPEHDMLHVYLMPMLEDVKNLQTADSAAAAQSCRQLAVRLAQYQTYFK